VASSYYIGIDGGGTKTYGIIADEKGNMLAAARRDSSNYLQVGIDKARENMIGMIKELCQSQSIDMVSVDYIFFGLAGAGRADDQATISAALIEGGLREPQFSVTADFTTALASGTFGEPGVIVISGTGSVCFALAADGHQERTGGWGTLLADEGSGYDFGREACRAVMRAFDGRGPATLMTDKILAKLNLDSPLSLVKWSLTEGMQKDNVAALSPCVFEALNEGDLVAEKIINKSIDSMAEMVRAVARKLDITEDSFRIVLAGGNFAHQPYLVSTLQEKISGFCPKAEAVLPKYEPIVGGVIMALRNSGIEITPEVLANLDKTWPAMSF